MKMIKTLLLALISVTFINTAHAEDPEADCIKQAELQAIAKNFPQFAELSKAPLCNDGSSNFQMLSALMFMRKTQFSANMPKSKDELFSGKFAANWYGYFAARINKLATQECAKGIIAFVRPGVDRTMNLCFLALTDRFSSVDRAATMMHEARHMDNFPHMTCTRGPRKDLHRACDIKITDGGSYAVSVESYAQFAKYAEGVHPALKAYSRSAALIYAEEAFDTPVKINRSETLLALTNALKFFAIDTKAAVVKLLGSAPALGKIIRRGQHLVLFPDDKTQNARYVFANDEGEVSQSPSEFISDYNAQTPEQKSNLVDHHIGAQWSVRIYKSSVVFNCDKTVELAEVQLPDGKQAVSLAYPDGYSREIYTVDLMTDSGEVLELSCVNKQHSIVRSKLKLDQKYTRVYKANGAVLGLLDGRLYKIENDHSTALPTVLDGTITEIVPQQSFEFFNQ
jgi:hypothetical protein